MKCQSELLDNLAKLAALKMNSGSKSLREKTDTVGKLIDDLASKITSMELSLKSKDSAKIVKSLASLREVVDALELEVDDSIWPLPKYSEMLFVL